MSLLCRSFWTVSLYGANVYVENIMSGLEKEEVHNLVTGKAGRLATLLFYFAIFFLYDFEFLAVGFGNGG